MIDQNIKIKQKRTFSDVINAAFAFIKQEYKSFWTVIIMYAGIPTLAYAIFNTVYLRSTINTFINIFKNQGNAQEFTENFGPQILLMYLLAIVMYLFFHGLTYSYIVLYSDKNENKHPREVWHLFTKKFLALFGYLVLTGIFIGIGYMIIVFIFAIGGSPFFVGIGIFASVVLIFYLMTVLSLLLIIKVRENVDYFVALGRCFHLVKNHWWETFGLILIAAIIGIIIQTIISLPVSSYVGAHTFLSEDPNIGIIPTILASVTSTLSTLIVTPLTAIFITFQYFSLVEHKDNIGLLEKINNINNSSDQVNE